jgi:meiotic recombination protein SPO11
VRVALDFRISYSRELYYRDQELFETQVDVNQAIREICCLLEATPWELRIMSTSKGLVAGDLKIIMNNDDVVDCSIEGGVLLPYSIAGLRRLDTSARFVLIVEKDTVFKKLLDSFIFDKLGYDMILVTVSGV